MSHPDATTQEHPRPIEPASEFPAEERLAPDRRLIEGSAPNLAKETRDLLHRRLLAASLMLAFSFGVFLIRDFVFPPLLQRFSFLHSGVFCLLIINMIALSGRWKPTLRQLRWLELATFGIITAYFIASQSLGLRARVRLELLDAVGLRILFKNSIIGTLFLMLTYGIFIPNNWRRAARVIVPMALAPLVAPLLLSLTSAEFRTVWQEAGTPERLSENALFLVLGAVTAIYGTHTINTFRTEAFEERSLNQYRLTKKLGSGGMGEVYLAEHQLLKRPCAIKLIRPGLSHQPRVLARFELEVRATAQLSHWNTVEVYDYGRTEQGTFYYVMEYLPGLSLQELVERHGPLPAGRVIYLLSQACDALHEAHRAGLIHRDLKPPNIFAAYRGARYDVAKLLDFGLVKPMKDEDSAVLTREGMVTGSPLYMAPEQVTRSHEPDPRTDIYAMGGIAYFLLVGQPPFVSSDSMAVMIAHARDPIVPPSQVRDDIPNDLEKIVLRCLEKNPEHRFQDAESLARALLACQGAGGWSAEQAEIWWQANEPLAAADTDEKVTMRPGPDSADLTRAETHSPTLGASEVEAVAEPISSEGINRSLSVVEDEARAERTR